MKGIQKVDREIKYFIVHCAFTKESMDVSVQDIDRWHRDRGWSGIGYNRYIKFDGSVYDGRSLTNFGAHTLGYNRMSIGVCLEGGMGEDGQPDDTLTVDQWRTVVKEFRMAQKLFPKIKIAGHNQFNVKPCPSFDVREYAKKHGIESDDIYNEPLLVKL